MEELTINQRIKMLVDEFDKGNKLAFSKRVGVSNQALGEVIGERQTNPSYPSLHKIAAALPQVRTEWLILGEGKMLKSEKSVHNSGEKEPEYEHGKPATHNGKTVATLRLKSSHPAEPLGTDFVQQVAKNTREIELMQQTLETVVAELRQLTANS